MGGIFVDAREVNTNHKVCHLLLCIYTHVYVYVGKLKL